jgi:hypothetical protein
MQTYIYAWNISFAKLTQFVNEVTWSNHQFLGQCDQNLTYFLIRQ